MEGTHPSNKSHHGHGNNPLGELLQLKQALFRAVSYLVSHQCYQWDVMLRSGLRHPSHLISNMSVRVREEDKSIGFKSATCSLWGNKQSAFSLPYNKPWGCEGGCGWRAKLHSVIHCEDTHFKGCKQKRCSMQKFQLQILAVNFSRLLTQFFPATIRHE